VSICKVTGSQLENLGSVPCKSRDTFFLLPCPQQLWSLLPPAPHPRIKCCVYSWNLTSMEYQD